VRTSSQRLRDIGGWLDDQVFFFITLKPRVE